MKCPECGETYAQHAHGWYIIHKDGCGQVAADYEMFGLGVMAVPGSED